jgi:hypothetical protein
MNKRKADPTKREKRDPTNDFLRSPTGQDFIDWWKEHRHSGYATKGTETRWGMTPHHACRCDRYMAEFYVDTGTTGELRYEWTPAELKRP